MQPITARAFLVTLLTFWLCASMPGSAAAGTVATASVTLQGTHARLDCTECHGPGDLRPATDAASPVSRAAIAATCGRCHEAARDATAAGAHGNPHPSLASLVPTCVSCHGAHDVAPARDPATGAASASSVAACARCHEDPLLLGASELPIDAVDTYHDSLHGTAHSHGSTDVATCAACHGAHDVRPAADPASRIHATNLPATCGQCHRVVTDEMVAAAVHPEPPRGLRWLVEKCRVYYPVAGSPVNPLLISGMGALVGFLSGLFGVGGGFLMTPLLIFIGIPAAVAAATDAAQITAGASSGALSHARLGNVDFKMGLVIVAGGWTGGFVGVQLVRVLRNLGNFDFFLKLVYVLVLGFIGATMLMEGVRAWRGRGGGGEPRRSSLTGFFARLPLQMHFAKSGLTTSALLPATAGFLVGVLAAFLGVGGGFIMLPAMIYIIGIPTRVAVGTDLFQIVLTSANVTLQQALVNHTVDVLLAVTLFAGSVVGAQFGVMASRRLRGEQIRVFLALIVLVVMGILLVQLLTPPAFLIDFARSGGGH